MSNAGSIFGENPWETNHPRSRAEKEVVIPPKGGVKSDRVKWYGPEENPYGVRVLDCRALTWEVVATTTDSGIAERYDNLRGSDGRDLIGAPIKDVVKKSVSLKFAHNGAPMEGALYKAGCMDEKWDVYIYNSTFLFARSWTGELWYRAVASVGASEIHVTEIECARSEASIAACHVYFLIGTHALRRVLPHRLPEDTPKDPMTMATRAFGLFGRFGYYATFEDITHIPILPAKSPV